MFLHFYKPQPNRQFHHLTHRHHLNWHQPRPIYHHLQIRLSTRSSSQPRQQRRRRHRFRLALVNRWPLPRFSHINRNHHWARPSSVTFATRTVVWSTWPSSSSAFSRVVASRQNDASSGQSFSTFFPIRTPPNSNAKSSCAPDKPSMRP